MDMGFKNAMESLMIGGAIVGFVCVLPLLLVLAVVVLSFRRSKKDD